MSLRPQHMATHAATTGMLPQTGGGGVGRTGRGKKKAPAKRLTAEQRAEEARLNDPYGDHSQTSGPRRRTRVVRRRVRRRRVSNGKTQSNYGTTNSGKTQGKAKAQNSGQAQLAQHSSGPSNQHMMRRMNANSNLARMSANFQSQNSGQSAGPKTPAGKKMAMLGNLQQMMKNDYAAMKANENDGAFTYRTSEARQLVATLGTMVASSNKKSSKKDGKAEDKKPLSPKQFAAQKGLLRRLKAMSDPTGELPPDLPTDYRPFESVA